MSVEEFSERVRIISRGGKKDAVVGNVVIEVSRSACERLISEGRMYVEWSAFKVRLCFGVMHVMDLGV